MIKLKTIPLLMTTILSLGIVACDKKAITNVIGSKKIECSDVTGTKSILSLLNENAEKAIKNERDDISISEIRAVINTLKLGIENIRTSKEDPNSTKVFCEAEVTLTTPVNMIKEANEALKASGDNRKIDLIFEDYGLKPSNVAANSYESTITYNLQPTDDGKTILSVIDDGNEQLISSIKDIVLWSRAKKDIGKVKANETSQNNQTARANATVEEVNTSSGQIDTSSNTSINQADTQAKRAYLNCSIGGKVASKKCTVVEQTLVANTPDTISYFGSNGSYRLITIMWPDNDVSEYAILDDTHLINLKKPKSGNYSLQNAIGSNLNLDSGFGINKNGNEYISLW